MPTFAVTVNPASLQGKQGSEQTIVVTATNTIARPATARASLRLPNPAAAWVTAQSDRLGRFPEQHATQDFPFTLKLPADAPAGRYTLLFDVIDVELGDDHFGTSPALLLEVEEAGEGDDGEPPPPRRWWILLVAAAIVLAVGGFVVWRFFIPEKMPDLREGTYAQALANLDTARFIITRVDTLHSDTTSFERGRVFAQSIPPGAKLKSDSNALRLVVQQSWAVVPAVVGMTADAAANRLGLDSLLLVIEQELVESSQPIAKEGIVIRSTPPAGTLGTRGQSVILLVRRRMPCVRILNQCVRQVHPAIIGRMDSGAARINRQTLKDWKPPSP